MVKVSVIVPIYNSERYLKRCIDSLISQTLTEMEFILINDGSTDSSDSIISEFNDSRIKYFKRSNHGIGATRNFGIDHASGEFIGFLDSDDYLLDTALEKIHDKFEQSDPDIVCFGFVTEPEGMKVPPLHTDDIIECIHKKTIFPTIWKNAYKRFVTDKLLETTEPFYCNMGEDVYFSHVLFTFGKKIDYVDDILYYYQRDTGMSSASATPEFSLPRKYLKDTYEAASHIVSFIEKYNPDKLETTKKATSNMNRFVLTQHFIRESDYRKIIQYIMEIKNLGYEELFDYACNSSIKKKVLYDLMEDLDK